MEEMPDFADQLRLRPAGRWQRRRASVLRRIRPRQEPLGPRCPQHVRAALGNVRWPAETVIHRGQPVLDPC